jgi:AbrB family looped-hinge helix DNA binding protein
MFYFLPLLVRMDAAMRVTSKGQITIPEQIRREEGFLPGTDIEFVRKDGDVVLRVKRQGRKSKREREIRTHLDQWRGSAAPGWTTARVMDLTRGDD